MSDEPMRLFASGLLPEGEFIWHLPAGEGEDVVEFRHQLTTSMASRSTPPSHVEVLIRFHMIETVLQPGREPNIRSHNKDVVLCLNQANPKSVTVHVKRDQAERADAVSQSARQRNPDPAEPAPANRASPRILYKRQTDPDRYGGTSE